MVNNPTRAYVKFCCGSYYYIDNLDEILEESLERKANSINNRTNNLLFKEGSELKLIHVRTGKEEILSRYDAELIADKILSFVTIESEKISTSANHYENNVPLLFEQPNSSIPGMRYNFKSITSDDFTSSMDENACQVEASVNTLRYWHARRSVSNLPARGTDYDAFTALHKQKGRFPIVSLNIAG